MPTAVVTGANSGIGHAFAALLIKEGYYVHALDMRLDEPIKALGCPYSSVDLTQPRSISDFADSWGDRPIDLLLNVAGIMANPPDDALKTTDFLTLSATFATNTFGPFLLTQALLPAILASKASPTKVAVVSSRVGSIADNSTGGNYAYRASKAAVNCIFKSLSVDLKEQGVMVAILHPGMVKTNIFDGIKDAPGVVEPEEAAKGLWDVLKGKGLEDSGRWWHRDGYELPW